MDANQDVYAGKLALTLFKEPLNITCLMEGAMGCQVPNSHFSGSKRISTIFGSAGVMMGNAMCFPYWYGVGDHHIMVLAVSAKASFDGKLPTNSSHTACNLCCNISCIRIKYCKTLEALVHWHKIHQKLLDLELMDPLLTASEYPILHNKLDKALGDMMTCAERACTMYKGGSLEFRPTVGQWIKNRSVLKGILQWQGGKVPDTHNMLQVARHKNIENPLTITRIKVEARLLACMWDLFKLHDKAPALRQKHLQWRLSLAKHCGDDIATNEISRIIATEAQKQCQKTINGYVDKPHGKQVMRVISSTPTSDCTITT